ncbi:type I-F CRISPR-associated protein Csy1 [Marinobacter sp. 1-3A]|uniref:type I-F CRISPR-associated protein Csy1 n=1 Tax=Marinobacter sp. 1-3A TaxID=2582920 RepID=UPI00190846A2|nr:type I-F CRISPR-associated protein Csy1 [Marinobacter sp. 1-3A]MBK1872883.1 type I-F CRISPR-associated protein Csy1 [Marinobacter sp. 1-3A]
MVDAAIEGFFAERKEAWLKKNLTTAMLEVDVRSKEQECESMFALKNWLPNAAHRIESRALTTHPSKFTHPSTGVGKKNQKNGTYVTPVLFQGKHEKDGFLKTGNVACDVIDSVGNAGELDVEEFLMLRMCDGYRLLDHIEKESELAQKLLSIEGHSVSELRRQLLVIKKTSEGVVTNSRIKQIFFPVYGEGYHQLSLLTNSAYVFELRKRIDVIRFSEQAKQQRDLKRQNKHSELGFKEIYNITTIGFGGTKPANISVLNNQNAGKAHLLLSMPPELSPRATRLPTRNFFGDTLYARQLQETFQGFHRLLIADHNNMRIREGRNHRIQEYIDQVIFKMWQVRKAFEAQPHSRPESLPGYQKIWLFPEHEPDRMEEGQWLTTLVDEVARHFINSYEKVLGKAAIQLGDDELGAFNRIVEQSKEALL